MKRFTIHDAATMETREAIAHYEAQRSGLGREFRQEFASALDRIRRMPSIFAAIDERGTRKYRLQKFPYTIYYVDLDDEIWVAAVAHQKRRPGYWLDRTPDSESRA